jgi:outer membrane protein
MGQAGQVTVDGVRYRNVTGATGQWQYNIDARNQVSAFGQYAQLNYLTNRTRDADRYLAGASYAHMWRDGAVGFASAYLVQEKPEANNVKQYDFDGFGMRFGGRSISAKADRLCRRFLRTAGLFAQSAGRSQAPG